MKTISTLELRRSTQKVMRWAKEGQSMMVTHRGRPVFEIRPPAMYDDLSNDPFYRLNEVAEDIGPSLSIEEIDGIVYGK